jgi:hypothetical protein
MTKRKGGGGETVYVAPKSGMLYVPNMVIPDTATAFRNDFLNGATELVTLEAKALLNAYQFTGALQNLTKLESVSWPNQTSYQGGNTNTCIGCTALTQVQMGSIGHPVTSIDMKMGGATAGKTVTVYCTAISAITVGNAPWRAQDTVIYRDSTNGEVLTA